MNRKINSAQFEVRSATEADRHKLATLVHFSPYVHRHLDWRAPLDWLGKEPYLVAERNGQVMAALACPPDIPDLAWVRLFAVSTALLVDDAWDMMWPMAQRLIGDAMPIAALPLQSWFKRILEASNFNHLHDVVMLRWEDRGEDIEPLARKLPYYIRIMNYDDLDAVHALDFAAFEPVWQHSRDLLEIAFQDAAIATVAEDHHGILGYQVSTVNATDGHLARLAVHPRAQSSGVGYTLIRDLLSNFRRRGIPRVTVNTQTNNNASLALYQKVGFHKTGMVYPIFRVTY
jgi:[ribosomal protein S18]-alanine N-acetyltransferase